MFSIYKIILKTLDINKTKNKKNRTFLIWIVFIMIFNVNKSFAIEQYKKGDTLVPILYNSELRNKKISVKYFHLEKSNVIIENNSKKFYFEIDTIHIPFIDDFSKNLQKQYINQDNISLDSIIHDIEFTSNGNYVYALEYMYNKSYNYTFKNNIWDSTLNDSFIVIFYQDNKIFSRPTDTIIAWAVPNGKIDTNNQLKPVTADTIIFNHNDTLYYIEDDENSKWINQYTYINQSFAVDPPTIGVATFDGLGLNGDPYASNLSDRNAYGGADTLTSKPIFLKTKPIIGNYTNRDSLYFSFFYQPQGKGNAPEKEDSLLLEFYAPLKQKWNIIWYETGKKLHNFRWVQIPINDTNYFQDGFQFRFRNRATITGNLDHWNIDYVYLDVNRNKNDSTIDDVAFTKQAPYLLHSFYEVPWTHFTKNLNENVKNDIELQVRNNSSNSKLVNYSIMIEDVKKTHPVYTSRQFIDPNFEFQTTKNQIITHNYKFSQNSFEKDAYWIYYILNTTPDVNRNNDTLKWLQQFRTIYAYDDGSAELAYSVKSSNAKIAYEFDPLAYDDSLKAVYIYFPTIYENILTNPFKIKVWNTLVPNEYVLYESSEYIYPKYTKKRDLYTRYELTEPIPITGKFYIGIEQLNRNSIYIGFDANQDQSSKIYYNTGGEWENTYHKGSLMIRPDFGNDPYLLKTKNIKIDEIMIYPNPVSELISIKIANNKGKLTVYSVLGEKYFEKNIQNHFTLNVSNWKKGMYIFQININEKIIRNKVIVQ